MESTNEETNTILVDESVDDHRGMIKIVNESTSDGSFVTESVHSFVEHPDEGLPVATDENEKR